MVTKAARSGRTPSWPSQAGRTALETFWLKTSASGVMTRQRKLFCATDWDSCVCVTFVFLARLGCGSCGHDVERLGLKRRRASDVLCRLCVGVSADVFRRARV